MVILSQFVYNSKCFRVDYTCYNYTNLTSSTISLEQMFSSGITVVSLLFPTLRSLRVAASPVTLNHANNCYKIIHKFIYHLNNTYHVRLTLQQILLSLSTEYLSISKQYYICLKKVLKSNFLWAFILCSCCNMLNML